MKMKRRLLKRLCAFACTVLLMASFAGIHAQAQTPKAEVPSTAMQEIVPLAGRIEVYYREYNGKLQMRRWNFTRGYWVDPYWITISI